METRSWTGGGDELTLTSLLLLLLLFPCLGDSDCKFCLAASDRTSSVAKAVACVAASSASAALVTATTRALSISSNRRTLVSETTRCFSISPNRRVTFAKPISAACARRSAAAFSNRAVAATPRSNSNAFFAVSKRATATWSRVSVLVRVVLDDAEFRSRSKSASAERKLSTSASFSRITRAKSFSFTLHASTSWARASTRCSSLSALCAACDAAVAKRSTEPNRTGSLSF
mmetsp:Transcript_12452/g.46506  ORF Transcript_12452/g.46506 Transcript_12452/m.46506 type:complete len:231 (+) Transcript_12452:1949-2641(+)